MEARRENARRGELLVAAPIGYLKSEERRLEKDPDLRVHEAVRVLFRKILEFRSVRQTSLWFLEHGLELPVCTPQGETDWKRSSYATLYHHGHG